jgi:hypothetical protein
MTIELINRNRQGGSFKAEGFGDGGESHPQASLEAATLLKIEIQHIE